MLVRPLQVSLIFTSYWKGNTSKVKNKTFLVKGILNSHEGNNGKYQIWKSPYLSVCFWHLSILSHLDWCSRKYKKTFFYPPPVNECLPHGCWSSSLRCISDLEDALNHIELCGCGVHSTEGSPVIHQESRCQGITASVHCSSLGCKVNHRFLKLLPNQQLNICIKSVVEVRNRYRMQFI